MEAYPDRIARRLHARAKSIARVDSRIPTRVLQSVIVTFGRWEPGSVVTCAFAGGSTALRDKVAAAAQAWVQTGANITLSFKDQADKYREWRHTDLSYVADIRIGFDQEGYWSLVGAESIDPSVISAHEASMNFSGFVQNLPSDYAATVMHEFGHALGFQHEHQSPNDGCDAQFRWDDDSGYQPTTDDYGQYVPDPSGKRPGIYTVLSGPPNGWSRATVDHNLRQLVTSSAFIATAFDAKSIMKYFFEPWMFVTTECSCYSAQNVTLSDGDIAGMLAAYPNQEAPLHGDLQLAVDAIIASPHPPDSLRARMVARRSRLVTP